MNCAYLILGGNLGNRAALIEQAEKMLSEKGVTIVKTSSLFETAPWQMEYAGSFLNKVLEVNTDLSAQQLMRVCLEIEKKQGRTRTASGYVSRSMDIDILFFNDEVIKDESVEIPHPRLHLRRFVLVPMNELNPHFVHPALNKTISQLLNDCEDTGDVKKFIA